MRSVIDHVARAAEFPDLVTYWYDIIDYLPAAWSHGQQKSFAMNLATGMNNIGLNRSVAADFQAALDVLSFLLKHADQSHDFFTKWKQTGIKPERFFANDLESFFAQENMANSFWSYKEVPERSGRIDLLLQRKATPDVQLHVELKSLPEATFDQLVSENAGQAISYGTGRLSRIGVLYGQFGGEDTRNIVDCLRVVKNPQGPSSICAICIGHRGFGKIPSASGKVASSVPLSPVPPETS